MSDLTSPPSSPAPGPRPPAVARAWPVRAVKIGSVALAVALGVWCIAGALFDTGFVRCRDDGRCVQTRFARGFPWLASAQGVTNGVADGPLVELDHGRPRTLGHYANGRAEGCFTWWDGDGALTQFGRFRDGRKEGTWIVRDDTAQREPRVAAGLRYEERFYRDDVELTGQALAQRPELPPFDPCTPPGDDAWRAGLTRITRDDTRAPILVTGALSLADVKVVVDERRADLTECRRHVPFPPHIEVLIDAAGVTQTFAESAPCVRAVISGWRFPRSSGATTVTLDLAALVPATTATGPARIEVRASEDVTIFLDGKQVARGRAASLPVAPGEHTLRYERHSIGIDEERIVRVGPGEIADVDAYFAPIR